MAISWGRRLILLALLLLVGCGQSSQEPITVVTFNMYIGLDMEQKVEAFAQGGDVADVASEIFGEFQDSRPQERIALAARELASLQPDFIALQEAVLFEVDPLFNVDFLELLVEEIQTAGGPEYEVMSIDNFILETDVTVASFINLAVRFKDREAILYKKEFLPEGDPIRLQLSSHRDPVPFNDQELTFHRSLLGARFSRAGEQPLTVFTTHLEQKELGEVQQNQISEIIQAVEPYINDENLVLVGDFNFAEGDSNYDAVVAAGFTDTFRSFLPSEAGFTCCNLPDLSHTEAGVTKRIDLIFQQSALWQTQTSQVVLNQRDSIWPSDHFGVLSSFELKTKAP